ncbi:hypothetical protein GCM10017557_43550 [Streptomyces aurantiacus]|uniref:Uncharacterized protein n=1 Tax=Streptomyces aurantiacus TaxID=47760 RepID=A0A7G1P6Q6_9ACTN|nr:hypothetical protein GCM10017557_43550 [Streptomyces aurantiacus]
MLQIPCDGASPDRNDFKINCREGGTGATRKLNWISIDRKARIEEIRRRISQANPEFVARATGGLSSNALPEKVREHAGGPAVTIREASLKGPGPAKAQTAH